MDAYINGACAFHDGRTHDTLLAAVASFLQELSYSFRLL